MERPPYRPETSLHSDDYLPLRATRLDVLQRLIGLPEREDPIHYRTYDTCLDQGGDLTKLRAVGCHEVEGIADALALRFSPDAQTQEAHDQSKRPAETIFFCEIRVWRTGNRNQLPARLQHAKGFLQRVCAEAVQYDVVILQDLLEIVLL